MKFSYFLYPARVLILAKKLFLYNSFVFFENTKITRWGDLFSLVLLLSISNYYAYNLLTQRQNSFYFYQTEFSPAVMYACGYEFLNANEQHINVFLNKRTGTFSCTDIKYQQLKPLTAFQSAEYYLIFSVGIIWKIFGIGWKNLIPLFLILYSASMVATYYIFRLAMRKSISFLFTLLIATSYLQMIYLPQLRDYSVAPFVLWTIWISAQLVINNLSVKKRLLLSGITGFITGLGLGFRTDLLIMIPYFILMFFLFVKKESSVLTSKIIPILVFLIVFLIIGYPILHRTSQFGSNLPHVVILGLSAEFTQFLSLQQPKAYSIMAAYRDLIAYSMINSFGERVYNLTVLLSSPSKEYDFYGNLYLLNYIHYFPADFLIRIYASIYQILIMPFQSHSGYLFSLLKKINILFPFFSLIIIACYQVRLALFVLFSIIYLCSYPVLQFAPRHYFYLNFIGLWFLGFLGEYLFSFFYKKNKSAYIQHIKLLITTRWKIVSVAVASCIIVLHSLLFGMRIYQSDMLTQLLNYYTILPARTLLQKNRVNKDEISILLPTKIHQSDPISLETFFIKITTENCLAKDITLTLNFWKGPDSHWNIPQEIKISGKKGSHFFPIYNFYNPGPTVINECALPSHWVSAITYSEKDDSCLKDFSIVSTNNKVPLLLYVNLEYGWKKNKLYQSIS